MLKTSIKYELFELWYILWRWKGSQKISTKFTEIYQRVLQGCPPSLMWCRVTQETGIVVNRHLEPQSRQCSSTFLVLDSDFFDENPDLCGSPGSLLSWYGSLRLLVVPQTQEALEWKAISDKRGLYDYNDSQANTIEKKDFSECFQKWRHCWEKCVEYQGDDFEGG